MKKIAFIDMEGVLIPEIWKNFSKILKIPELSITTQEVPNYKSLMINRIRILKEHNISIDRLVEIVNEMDVIHEAKDFLEFLKTDMQFEIKIVSDCFYELLMPFLHKLNLSYQDVYCHNLNIAQDRLIQNVIYTRNTGKHEVIVEYQNTNYSMKNSLAIGDAFNDFSMLSLVDHGFLFNPSEEVKKKAPSSFHEVMCYKDIIYYLNNINFLKA